MHLNGLTINGEALWLNSSACTILPLTFKFLDEDVPANPPPMMKDSFTGHIESLLTIKQTGLR